MSLHTFTLYWKTRNQRPIKRLQKLPQSNCSTNNFNVYIVRTCFSCIQASKHDLKHSNTGTLLPDLAKLHHCQPPQHSLSVMISTILLLLLHSPSRPLRFTMMFVYVTIFQSKHWGSHIPSSWMIFTILYHVSCQIWQINTANLHNNMLLQWFFTNNTVLWSHWTS